MPRLERKPRTPLESSFVLTPTFMGARRNVATAPGLVFRWQWQFNSRRGAILLMHRPQMTRVPDQFFNPETLCLPVLKNKRVVYQAWNCHGYYMYLSSRSTYLHPLRCPDG